MVDLIDYQTAFQVVRDPSTSPESLWSIAHFHPTLRVIVAAHPHADEVLLDWMALLNDPAVSSVIAARRLAPASRLVAAGV